MRPCLFRTLEDRFGDRGRRAPASTPPRVVLGHPRPAAKNPPPYHYGLYRILVAVVKCFFPRNGGRQAKFHAKAIGKGAKRYGKEEA